MPTKKGSANKYSDKLLKSVISEYNKGSNEDKEVKVEDQAPRLVPQDFVKDKDKSLYSKLFGKSGTEKEHNVTVLKNLKDESSVHVPPKNPLYVFPKKETEKVVVAIEHNDRVLITGPTGSGKTSLCQEVCSRLNRPFIRLNATADMEASAFVGQYVVENGATVWKDGPLTEAVINGWVVLWDEWDVTPPEVAMVMQALLEKEGKLFLKEKGGTAEDKTYDPHLDFRLVCSGNTLGQGDDTGSAAGTQVQNSATLDRFGTLIQLNYLSKDHERKIINKATDNKLDKSVVNDMLTLARLIRTAYEQQNIGLTMSPRTLLNWADKMLYWGDEMVAFRIAFFDKLMKDDQSTVREFVQKVYDIEI